jgi:ankyrin repeat protein
VKLLPVIAGLLFAGQLAATAADDPLCAGGDALASQSPQVLAQDPLVLHRLLSCPLSDTDVAPADWPLRLLNAGVRVEQTDPAGRSALHIALQQLGSTASQALFYQDTALLLLSRGASADLADNSGIRPLHLASAEPDSRISGELIALGADPLSPDGEGHHVLNHAVRYPRNSVTFALLLNTAAGDLDEDDRELLIEALIQGQRADLLDQLLLRFPTTELDPVDASRALAQLLWQGASADSAERFWRAGAEAPLVFSQGGGDLAWRLATEGQHVQLDWLLADGFPLNALPESGFPPLFFANAQATARLLARGADPNLSSREHGTPAAAFIAPPAPFDQGGSSLDASRLKQLLDAGLQPDRRDNQGMTALERALDGDQLWLVQALLKAGADPGRAASGERSLLPKALMKGRLPAIQSIIRGLPDVADRHPLLLLDYVGSEQPDTEVAEVLLVAGLSPDMAGAEGETALLRAARLQRWPLVDLLLRYGADPQRLNAQGCSLHCYSWSMPQALQQKWGGGDKPTGWQWPAITGQPAAFFALGLSPMLALWLAATGLALARRLPMWPSLLWMLASGAGAILLSSAMLYQCDPCLITDTAGQHYLTMAVAALLFAIGPWRKRLAVPAELSEKPPEH